MTQYTRQIVIRIDDPLHEALAADAEANGRTIAQSVRFLLRRAVTVPAAITDEAPR